MYRKTHVPILRNLLIQIAKHAGFSSCQGLFDGKMGTSILLYHGARYMEIPELEQVADSLVDDVLEGLEQMGFDFSSGLSGVVWGIHHLKVNGFIEPESNFFDELDTLFFENKASVLKNDVFQYPLLGLYINARLADSSNKTFLNERAMDYCKHMLTQLDAFNGASSQLTPFLYCLWQWRSENSMFNNIVMAVCHKLSYLKEPLVKSYQSDVLSQLYNKLCGMGNTSFSEEYTLTDIKTIFFYKLLFEKITLPSWNLINGTFAQMLSNRCLTDELLLLSNHQNQGLTQNISGFAWSLLQYLNHNLPQIEDREISGY